MAVASRSGTRAGWKSLRTTSMAVGASRAMSLARNVLAQVHHSCRHGDRGQESESAMIGLVLVEVQQIHTAIVQEALDVIGLEGGDEERGIQLSLLQGRWQRQRRSPGPAQPASSPGRIRIRSGR